MSRKFILVVLLALTLTGLNACGKRAAHVDPPEDADDTRFPIIYPDPKTNL